MPVGIAQRPHNLRRGFHPLNPDRQQLYRRQGIPAAENTDHVVNRRPRRGSDDGDGLGIRWQRLLMLLAEKPLFPQLFLQLLEGRVEISYPIGAESVAVELVGSVPGIDADPSHSDDLHPVLRPEPEPEGLSLKHNTPDSPFPVLQGKVVVTGGIELVVGYFAPDINAAQLRHTLQHRLNQAVKF